MGDTGIGLPPPPPAPSRNQKAVWSLILGVLGIWPLMFVGSIVALVLGRMAKSEIRQAGGAQTGLGMAKAGVVLGWFMIAVVVAWILFFALMFLGCLSAPDCGP